MLAQHPKDTVNMMIFKLTLKCLSDSSDPKEATECISIRE